MKKYLILWDRNDYGKLVIEANSQEEAEEKFNCGDFKEEDLNIKNGGFELVEIKDITDDEG